MSPEERKKIEHAFLDLWDDAVGGEHDEARWEYLRLLLEEKSLWTKDSPLVRRFEELQQLSREHQYDRSIKKIWGEVQMLIQSLQIITPELQ